MRIRFVESVAGPGFSFGVGDETDLPEPVAADMLRCGFAEPLDGKPEAAKAKEIVREATVSAPRAAVSRRGQTAKKK